MIHASINQKKRMGGGWGERKRREKNRKTPPQTNDVLANYVCLR